MIVPILLGVLALCVLGQLYYTLYYFWPLTKYKDPEVTERRPVSVVVAAHNELENLMELLPMLLEQDYPQFEIVVVDDRSDDDTEFYLYELAQQYPHLKLVTIQKTPEYLNSKKYALALGIRAAKYEHLLFTDADCRPFSNRWIEKMQSGYNTGADVVLGYSPYATLKGFLNHLIRYETFLTAIQYLSQANKGHAYMGVGRNLSYTKTCFFRNKGFASHIKMTGGDDDLFVRDAAKNSEVSIVLDKEAQTVSIPKRTFREWLIQKRRHMSVGREYNRDVKRRIGAFVICNVLFYVLLIVIPFFNSYLGVLAAIVALRYLAVLLVYALAARRLEEKISLPLLPVLDIVYFFNYLFLGVSVLMFKKIRWK